MKVTLFATCLVDMFETNIGKATVELLEHLGCDVTFPTGQICCGQPAYNSGYVEDAKKAMKHMIDTFDGAEYVVAPSGSCIYMFKKYEEIFAQDPIYGPKAKRLAECSYELTDFIVNVLQVKDVGSTFEGVVTYHASCHMTRLLGVQQAPLTLLQHIPNVEYVELPNRGQCCGFGGTFSVKMAPISEEMVDEKVEHIIETDAQYIVGADAGCLMNIGGRINRRGVPVEVKHIAEVLNERKVK